MKTHEEELRAALEKVTAERDEWKKWADAWKTAGLSDAVKSGDELRGQDDELAALRARAESVDATNMVLRGAVTAVAAQRDNLLAALEAAARQFDFTVGALAKGHTVSVGSLQNCAAAAWSAVDKAKGNT